MIEIIIKNFIAINYIYMMYGKFIDYHFDFYIHISDIGKYKSGTTVYVICLVVLSIFVISGYAEGTNSGKTDAVVNS
jgi:hypothetical protein